MKKTVKLSEIAEHIEMASDGTDTFYNELTGEFYWYSDFGDRDERDLDEEEGWLHLPSQREANEYSMMSDFADTVRNSRKREQLEIALSGKGAFRRFKDAVLREGIEEAWYAFRDRRYLEFAREWCDYKNLPYDPAELPDEELNESIFTENIATATTTVTESITSDRQHELREALRSINSTIGKCEKVLLKFAEGTSQHTLTKRRLDAFYIAVSLIEKELMEES